MKIGMNIMSLDICPFGYLQAFRDSTNIRPASFWVGNNSSAIENIWSR